MTDFEPTKKFQQLEKNLEMDLLCCVSPIYRHILCT